MAEIRSEQNQVPRIVFAGDRQVAVDVLAFLRGEGVNPLGIMLPDRGRASHAQELLALVGPDKARFIWYGLDFKSQEAHEALRALHLDYIICVHFPLFIPSSILLIPNVGVINLHPAYLPYNRGWHTSVWALLDKTPFGATLHFMNDRVDQGDIIHQKALEICPQDTGDSLYKRALQLEVDVFREAWPSLAMRNFNRFPQPSFGSSHKRKDLVKPEVQEIDLNGIISAGDLINKIRALTTNRVDEASYFVSDGRRYRLRLTVTPDAADLPPPD